MAGNALAAFSSFYIQNPLDTTKPVLSSISASGSKVTLNYNEGLDPAKVPSRNQFTVLSGTTTLSISSVSIEGSKLILTLSSSLSSAGALTVSYAKGAPAMSDLAGNEADAFNGLPVSIAITFPAFVSGTASGTQVTLLYSTYLDPSSVPGASQYSIRANGNLVPVAGVSLSGTSVILLLGQPIKEGQTVTVTYTPSAVNPLRMLGGDAAGPLAAVQVANSSGANNAPVPGGTAAPQGTGKLDMKDVSVSSDVSPAGKAANRYTILNDNLLQAFQDARGSGSAKVSFKVPDGQKAGIVALPMVALQQALTGSGSASFELEFDKMTFLLPLQAIDFTKAAALVNAGGPAGYLLLSLDNSAAVLSGTLQAAITRTSLQAIDSPISLDASIVSSSGGTRQPLGGFLATYR